MSRPPQWLHTRRSLVRLLGGVAGTALCPVNFAGCYPSAPVSRGSSYVPTPEAPLTPIDDFYVNTNFYTPTLPSRWRLHVGGLVDEPIALSLDDLRALPQTTREVTLECIGNVPGGDLLSSAPFTGVRLRDVLALAGRSDRARGIQLLGLDGYPAYLPISIADADDGLLAHSLHGEPLPLDHGPPVRALLPGRYGMFSVKWLDSLTLTREYATYGSLAELVNFVDGRVRVRSRIDTLFDGAEVEVGESVQIAGLAVTAGVGVTRVQVDTGDGWRDAPLTFNRLDDERSPFLWSLWSTTWRPSAPGARTVRVRAWDTEGVTQDAEADFPYDSSAIHRLRVRVVARG
jgi:DMSO/TMAO reductase YedYZ molybdopterin-dependent catalytic subunit